VPVDRMMLPRENSQPALSSPAKTTATYSACGVRKFDFAPQNGQF
jgi:hypothetical protein